MNYPERVLVVGGGIAGLATARALLSKGIEPEVVERDGRWPRPGTGIYLPAGGNGLERAWGLDFGRPRYGRCFARDELRERNDHEHPHTRRAHQRRLRHRSRV